jgi:hypothetical protein
VASRNGEILALTFAAGCACPVMGITRVPNSMLQCPMSLLIGMPEGLIGITTFEQG